MRTVGHFIGGKHVKGTSGRFADVYQPMTGDVQAQVALASKAELRAAVENAKAAQPAWGATNPQRRSRILMKFLELVARDNDEMAELLAREHGKTIPDAKGDIFRGVEVVEYSLGMPELLKGGFSEGVGPGMDGYSIRQPLGVVAGITPFNFPAMIPMWKFAPAIACGNAFILKPSERDPGVPMKLAELMIEAGLPPGILNVVNGDNEAVDAILDDRDIAAVGFVGSSSIAQYIYERAADPYQVRLVIVFSAEFRVITEEPDGEGGTVTVVGDWQDAGPIERSFTRPYVVQQVQSVLTAQ